MVKELQLRGTAGGRLNCFSLTLPLAKNSRQSRLKNALGVEIRKEPKRKICGMAFILNLLSCFFHPKLELCVCVTSFFVGSFWEVFSEPYMTILKPGGFECPTCH